MKNLYTATVTATGGRDGKLVSSDNILNLEVRAPKELGGVGGATNPEQLFAAGYAACFESALNLVARMKKIKVEKTEVTAHVTLGKDDDGGYELGVKMDVSVAGVELDVAKELVEAAHQVCPYSRATRGNINVELNHV
ncbi:organic hydroperoxide resistance protein [Paenibacillus sp. PL91]|uniref:organic hydroperoxide resistance protein n=1 Tax=Paenibacillus sp. PL91 TaxID=2729538 RepID=UPI00145F20D0|nr:organic hydroperoxide resistance protein [Paenibacillus sp. PL91]MBC9204309.1 organic hydroperoxide resistance protein [Paenibacillus sp. PL91]